MVTHSISPLIWALCIGLFSSAGALAVDAAPADQQREATDSVGETSGAAPAPVDLAPDAVAPDAVAPASSTDSETSVDEPRWPFRVGGAALAVVGATLGVVAFFAVSVAVFTVFSAASAVIPQAAIFAELRPLAVVLLPVYMGAGAGLLVATVAKPMNALATGAIVAGATGVATLAGGLLGAATLGAFLAAQGVGQPSSPYFGDPIVFGLVIGGVVGGFIGATTGAAIGSLGSTVIMGALVGDRPSWWSNLTPDARPGALVE